MVHNVLTMLFLHHNFHILLLLPNAMHIHKNVQLIIKKILILINLKIFKVLPKLYI